MENGQDEHLLGTADTVVMSLTDSQKAVVITKTLNPFDKSVCTTPSFLSRDCNHGSSGCCSVRLRHMQLLSMNQKNLTA